MWLVGYKILLWSFATIWMLRGHGANGAEECNDNLGMQSKRIPDEKITSSSKLSSNHAPFYARLDRRRAWCSSPGDKSPYIQILLDEEKLITGMKTQGSFHDFSWAKKYDVMYMKEKKWTTYKENLTGNMNSRSWHRNKFDPPIRTRSIRVYPKDPLSVSMDPKVPVVPCLRLELYGCSIPVMKCWDLDVLPPQNGQRTGIEFRGTWGVSFSCNQGYELIGNSSLTCHADGQWSGIVPICKDLCESKQCETWQKCVYDRANGATCVCREDLDCPADFQPVCGSDAKRYNNDCIMKARACREGKSVKKVSGGSCTPGAICQIVPTSKCRAQFNHFYFNSETKICEPIIAGGCHPSGWNGFTTMKDCNRTCSVDVCTQSTDPGPCETSVTRWAFDPKAGRCKRFNYGGCFGNENNFDTKDKCNQRCPPTAKTRDACPKCSHMKVRKACKESNYAFIGKVQSKLPEDSTRKYVRYLISIDQILKNTNGSLSVGTAVVNVPYDKTTGCPCPSLPKATFLFMGQVIIKPTKGKSIADVVVIQPAFVQMRNKNLLTKMKAKCAKFLYLKELN